MTIEEAFSKQKGPLVYYVRERGNHERKKDQHKFYMDKIYRPNGYPDAEFVRWVSIFPLLKLK